MSDDATPKSELIQHSGVISKVNSIHHRGLNFIPMPLDTMLHTFWFNLLSLNCFSFFFPSFSTLKKGAFRKLCFCLVISTTLLSPRMMYIWMSQSLEGREDSGEACEHKKRNKGGRPMGELRRTNDVKKENGTQFAVNTIFQFTDHLRLNYRCKGGWRRKENDYETKRGSMLMRKKSLWQSSSVASFVSFSPLHLLYNFYRGSVPND